MIGDEKNFLRRCIAENFPPHNPLRMQDWSGFAFDRNRYESFAPDDVWHAWFQSNLGVSGLSPINVISYRSLKSELSSELIGADLSSLRNYWMSDLNFVNDHYIYSPAEEWIVRLDQDVTLFAGTDKFIRDVVRSLGGYNEMLKRMDDDFSPGENDPAGLREYSRKILKGPF